MTVKRARIARHAFTRIRRMKQKAKGAKAPTERRNPYRRGEWVDPPPDTRSTEE